MRSLVIGMGIGELYKQVLDELRHEVVTVDSVKPADYYDFNMALDDYGNFDCVFICTPNNTHEAIAYAVAKRSKIVFIEKPGVADSARWQCLVDTFPHTRFIMVKNNQYRDIIEKLKIVSYNTDVVDIRWINNNRVPSPGSWFTDVNKSFGGVEKDLMPHLLSFITVLFPNSYKDYPHLIKKDFHQRWNLADLTDTAYGTVNPNGVYNVNDYAYLEMKVGRTHVYLTADWRSKKIDDQCLQVVLNNHQRIYFDLGLCPEIAYKNMIKTATDNITNNEFWQDQLEQDLWIHRMTE
jgi:predicted dehydrogenase